MTLSSRMDDFRDAFRFDRILGCFLDDLTRFSQEFWRIDPWIIFVSIYRHFEDFHRSISQDLRQIFDGSGFGNWELLWKRSHVWQNFYQNINGIFLLLVGSWTYILSFHRSISQNFYGMLSLVHFKNVKISLKPGLF